MLKNIKTEELKEEREGTEKRIEVSASTDTPSEDVNQTDNSSETVANVDSYG